MPDGDRPTPQDFHEEGLRYLQRGALQPAEMYFRAALGMDSNYVPSITSLAGAKFGARKWEAGFALAKRAHRLAPTDPYARFNVGAMLNSLGFAREALEHFEALDAKPDLPQELRAANLHNAGIAYNRLAQWGDALNAFEREEAIAPLALNLTTDRAVAKLGLGKFREGVADWDGRFQSQGRHEIWKMGVPEWKGESLDDKRVIVHSEQGFGDTLMLARFIPHLIALGCAKIGIVTSQPLLGVLQWNVPAGVQVFETTPAGVVSADYHMPMFSLLRFFGGVPEDISDEPYMKAPLWPEMPRLPNGPKVGIAWSSGLHAGHYADDLDRRVVPLEMFFPLLAQGWRLISLQKHGGSEEIVPLGAEAIISDPMGQATDFACTAAIIDQLDLVISVDSAVAHLAGAMGKPVLMLAQLARCWRWLDGKTGYPWYRDLRIFQQVRPKSWDEPVTELLEAAEAALPN